MADKKTDTGGQESSNQDVINLLKSILDEFRKQVISSTPPPLTADAQKAVDAFKEITEALDVKPK